MRILLTTDTVGGVWTFTRELSSELLGAGHDVALVSFGRPPNEEQIQWTKAQSKHFFGSFRYFASDVPLEWMQENDTCLKKGATDLLRISDRFRPDILHSNQFCYGALELGVPKLVTAHSDVLSWAAACRPSGLEPSPWLNRYCDLVQGGLAGADAISAPTQWMADALAHHYGSFAPLHVVLNGRSIRPASVTRSRQKQAVSVGRLWDEAKNISMLRDVFSPLPILIAGERQHERARAPELTGSVKLLGQLTEASLLDLYCCSSLYLATSIYEPFGLAPLEAALCDCAVLANDIPSLREVWGYSALYFRDAGSLSALLLKLSEDERSLAAARRASHKRALELSARRMAAGYLALYSDLLSRCVTTKLTRPVRSRQEFAVHAA